MLWMSSTVSCSGAEKPLLLLLLCIIAFLPTYSAEARPIVIAHRGASGYRPEETVAAYELAAGALLETTTRAAGMVKVSWGRA